MLPWIWASFMIHDDPSSARVVHPYLIGDELVGDGIPTRFVIDIAAEDVMTAAAMAPAAFRRIHDLVLPERQAAADQEQQRNREALARHPEARVNRHHEQFLSTWWQLSWRRPTMIAALFRLPRDIELSAHASRAPPARVSFVSSEIHLVTQRSCPGWPMTAASASSSPLPPRLVSGTMLPAQARPSDTSKTVFDSFP
jgi:hypothetical protein